MQDTTWAKGMGTMLSAGFGQFARLHVLCASMVKCLWFGIWYSGTFVLKGILDSVSTFFLKMVSHCSSLGSRWGWGWAGAGEERQGKFLLGSKAAVVCFSR